MTIVQIGALSTDGDGMYRVHQPAAALGAAGGVDVFNVHYLSRWRDVAALAADVLVVYFTIDVELFRILEQRRRLGKPSVCEINDYFLDVQPWNPVHASWSNPRRRQYLLNLMRRCGAVQVSSPPLAEHFRPYNQEIHVFPNQIAALPPPRARGEVREVVVGWGGSAGHLQDVERVAPALVRWLATQPTVRLAIMADPLYARLFEGAPPGRVRFAAGGDLDHYLAFVRGLDVGIAPLERTEYNRCRSDVKFLEYAANGAVAVVERREPYVSVRDGETGFLVGDDSELCAVLDRLVASPALRRDVAAAAHAYVERERRLEDHVGRRRELYDQLTRRRPVPDRDVPAELRQLSRRPLRALPGLERRGEGHWQLEPQSPAERKFLDGLAAMESDARAAAFTFAEATRLAPDYYQAHYFAGRCLARLGRPDEAARAYHAAVQLNPFYSRPLRGLADLGGPLAGEYERRCAALNPPLEPIVEK